ncbi:lipase maturation factor family protein [Haloechinothrix sp. LS1_15]|uniref:lipase maturation factor family protein n=1 Tax=Haloechinothrix sp. LS1_15 TaxID=2652248 RepID=UPI002947716C|nr:lipase maturation factor family protein [Haloechinothrix sp. LS1_15]MDV6012551.1 lipase maturation factor family protein [Haloechinothrix sp. LS1_15]
MEWFGADGYWLSTLVFQRGLALVYLVAFLSAALQFRALIGEHGITPVPRYTSRVSFRRSPSLFHLYYSDRFFALVAWTGVVISAALLFGMGDDLPLWAHMAVWALLWVLYVSTVNVGQVWYGFGWESLLCEVGFLAIFLGPATMEPALLVLLALRWVLFRVEFGAGLIKLRGDPCWRDLTCLYYHHETQPMPNPLSWYSHHLPKPLHRMEVAANHVTQLVLPFLLFLPQPVASVAAIIMIVTQLWLVASGNFAWLNVLTIVIALSVIADGVWAKLLPVSPPTELDPAPTWFQGVVLAVTALVLVLSYWPVRNLLSRTQVMNRSFEPLHLVNTYGAFGAVTRERYEVVIEGTRDDPPGPGAEWREYEFKGKPGDVTRRPPQVAPYHLRLDWLMWFAALSPAYAEPWVRRFVAKLLAGDRATLKLLRHNPFPDSPPTYVRAWLYRYRFTTPRERRDTGAWWHREPSGRYLPPVTLSD